MTATAHTDDFETRDEAVVNRVLARQRRTAARQDRASGIALAERFVRVEEELKHQRELIHQGFDFMGKRFEDMRQDANRQNALFRWSLGIVTTLIPAVITADRFIV